MINTSPKYKHLASILSGQMQEKGYKPGDKFLSAREIGSQFEVSIATASKAVQILAQDGRVAICRGAGSYVREPRPSSASVAGGIKIVSIVMFSEMQCRGWGGAVNSMLAGLRDALPHAVLRVEYAPRGHWRDALSQLSFGKENAYVIMSGSPDMINFFAYKDSPAVLIGTPEQGSRLSAVTNCENEAMAQVVDLLAGKGHKSIIYIAPPEEYWVEGDRARYGSFKEKLVDLNLTDVAAATGSLQCPPINQDAVCRRIKDIFLVQAKPTAIICWNSMMCCWIGEALRETGLRIPQDVALFSLDDSDINELVMPRISSLKLNTYAMGFSAGRLIVASSHDVHKKPIVKVHPYEIAERETT